MTARLLNLTPAEYHADPCEVPSLSASVAKILVTESPLHAWYQHPKLGRGIRRDATDSQETGTLIHRLLLGKGGEIAIAPDEWHDAKGKPLPAVDWRTKEAKAWWETAESEGKIPVLRHQIDGLLEINAILREKLASQHGITLDDSNALREQPMAWNELGASCRCMFDWVRPEEGEIIDLKTIHSCNPRVVSKHVANFCYDIQFAAYSNALTAYRPEMEGLIRYTLVFVEVEPPFDILVAHLSSTFKELGQLRWGNAIKIWNECMATGVWPGYATGTVTLEPPAWLLADLLETEE
jgi:hypothetical protein